MVATQSSETWTLQIVATQWTEHLLLVQIINLKTTMSCSKSAESTAYLAQKRMFYNSDFFGGQDASQRTKHLPRACTEEYIDILRNWETSSRKRTTRDYRIAGKFQVKSVRGSWKLFRGGRIVVPHEDIFDKIYDLHLSLAHPKCSRTHHSRLKKLFYGITENACKVRYNTTTVITLSNIFFFLRCLCRRVRYAASSPK